MTSTVTIVAGMHRSGTSLMASILQAAGISMGGNLLPADANNRLGYYEDVEILSLHQQILTAATPPAAPGHHDWGWTVDETLDETVIESFRPAARTLVEPRLATGARWGWKDPRHTVLLDFWEPLLPDAGYVLVYRYPWDVADSMQRLGAPVFLQNPSWAWRIWTFYNRRLLAFRRQHRDRTLLISTNALANQSDTAAALLQKNGVAVSGEIIRNTCDGEHLHAIEGDDPLIALSARVHSEAFELLRELDQEADIGSGDRWTASSAIPRNARPPGTESTRVAVVVPCFNHGDFAIEAVASCERIFTEPYELVIVDDGSTEERTKTIVSRLGEAGYSVVHQENRGLAASRNEGVRRTTSPLVIPLDADNRLRPGYQKAVALMSGGGLEADVVHGAREEFGLRRAVVPPFEMDTATILMGNRIDACAVIRRELLERCGLFDGDMPFQGWEDWDLWLSGLECGAHFETLEDIGFDYRVRPSSMASTLLEPAAGQATQRYLVEKHRELYLRHLPDLLPHAQEARREVEAYARSLEQCEENVAVRERVSAELTSAAANTTREKQELERALAQSESMAEAARERAESLEEQLRAMRTHCGDVENELRRWQERVAAMETTAAWRLRRFLLRMRKGR